MQIAQLLVKLYSTEPKYNFMPLIRVLIGSNVRKLINWVEFAQTLVNMRCVGFLYKTSLWSCRQETMPIHKVLTTGKYEHSANYIGYNMTMVPNEYAKIQFNEHASAMGYMERLFHLEAFNPRSILAWAAYTNAKVARMVTYGFVLTWTKGGYHALASRAITLAKMANLKQKDPILDENMLYASWPNIELCWSAPSLSANKDRVHRWNAWVMANTTAWGIKPNATAFA